MFSSPWNSCCVSSVELYGNTVLHFIYTFHFARNVDISLKEFCFWKLSSPSTEGTNLFVALLFRYKYLQLKFKKETFCFKMSFGWSSFWKLQNFQQIFGVWVERNTFLPDRKCFARGTFPFFSIWFVHVGTNSSLRISRNKEWVPKLSSATQSFRLFYRRDQL